MRSGVRLFLTALLVAMQARAFAAGGAPVFIGAAESSLVQTGRIFDAAPGALHAGDSSVPVVRTALSDIAVKSKSIESRSKKRKAMARVGPVAFFPSKEAEAAGEDSSDYQQEKAFLLDVLGIIRETPAGKELFSELSAEGARLGTGCSVFFWTMGGTQIVVEDGVEAVKGREQGETISGLWIITINRGFLDFQDSVWARLRVAEVVAHELSHAVWSMRIKGRKQAHEAVERHDLSDEITAYARGNLVFAQACRGLRAIRDAWVWKLARDPKAFYDRMKVVDRSYAVDLDVAEMQDPVPSYEKRLAALEAELVKGRGDLEKARKTLRRIAHFERAHGMQGRFSSLSERAGNDLRIVPLQMEDYSNGISAVRERLEFLGTDKGQALIAAFRSAAADPAYAGRIQARVDKDLRALRAIFADQTPAPEYPAGQMTPEELEALVRSDLAENPDHASELE